MKKRDTFSKRLFFLVVWTAATVGHSLKSER